MSLTNNGRDEIVKCLMGVGTIFNSSNARLGIGDSGAAFQTTQVDLQATNNKFRQVMDTGYPIINGNDITFKATYNGDQANFAWQEWGVANSATDGTLLNRCVEYNGTKLQGQTWIFEVTLTIQIGA